MLMFWHTWMHWQALDWLKHFEKHFAPMHPIPPGDASDDQCFSVELQRCNPKAGGGGGRPKEPFARQSCPRKSHHQETGGAGNGHQWVKREKPISKFGCEFWIHSVYQGQTPIPGEILRKNCACRNEWGVEVGVWAGPQCPLARL